jgi:glycosyltransferase involved in cell wall biosynthesis
MNILLVHDRYKWKGGEDAVVDAEAALLERHGHTVVRYEASNEAIAADGVGSRVQTAMRSIWNHQRYRQLRGLIRRHQIAVMHCHNTFPLVSPAAYYAAAAEHVPVVQTLHNYRLVCVNAQLFRNGGPCEACVGHSPLLGVIHACYRGSRLASAAVGAMLVAHRLASTWRRHVDRYIVLTDFARRLFVSAGLPADRVTIKPNFVDPDPGLGQHAGEYALFVGRLSLEKGVAILIDAWRQLGGTVPLRIVGDGPLRPLVEGACHESPGMTYMGSRSTADVLELMKQATFLVLPSLWYEGFPLVLIEAFSTGLPAVVSAHQSLIETIAGGELGWCAASGNAEDLATVVRKAWSSRNEVAARGLAAREAFLKKYSADANYVSLLGIYVAARHQLESN